MKRIAIFLAAAAVGALAVPALADVKAGVDAWERGDYARAITQWRPLAIAGDADAQFNLGQAYKLGRGVAADPKAAEDWYRKAALQGHLAAKDNYGLILFQNGNRQAAMPYIEESAGRGEPRAQYVLGTALFNGDMVAKDWVRAYALMTRASAAGIPAASASLAQMDRYIPLDQRQRGLALARAFESAAQRPAFADANAGPPRSAPQRRTVGAAALPPSSAQGLPPAPTEIVRDAPPRAPKPPVAKPSVAKPPVAKPPVAKPAAPVALASAGGWRIQLGAFGSDANARRAWSGLAGRLPGLSPSFPHAGPVVRLQAGPLKDRAAAQRACAASGTACIPVAP